MMTAKALSAPSPFAMAWEALSANGCHCLPINPRTKAPAEYRNGQWRLMMEWQRFRAVPASDVVMKVWGSWPACNIGVITGTGAGDDLMLACVDFDTDDAEILDSLVRALPASPVAKKGRRGHSAFYRVEYGTAGFVMRDICELLTDTRQTVVPPSIHPDTGQPYAWTSGEGLHSLHVSQLPVLTADDVARFRDTAENFATRPLLPAPRATVIQLPAGEETLWRRINNTAYENLDIWVPALGLAKLERTTAGYKAVATWRPSSTGRPIAERACNLSIKQGLGAKDFGTGESYTALSLVMAAMGLDLEDAVQWLGVRLHLIEEPIAPKVSVKKVAPPPETESVDPETGEIIEPGKTDVRSVELPDVLTCVPGLVGDITNWIVASAQKPSRVLALGAAIVTVGTVIGRAVSGPTETATHLYVAELAPTAAGKNHPPAAIKRLLEAANLESLIGPDEFMSMSAMVSFLKRQPLALCVIDEVGAYLKRIGDRKASSFERAMSKILRVIWGTSFNRFDTPEWASVPSVPIDAPAISILGSSTPEEFFDALGGRDIANGFLNRWLILATSQPGRKQGRPDSTVPDGLARALAALRLSVNQIAASEMHRPIGAPQAILRKLAWGHGAQSIYEEFEAWAIDQGDLYGRAAEMAQRLATIRAAGRLVDVISAEDMAWGRDVSHWSAKTLTQMAGDHIANNDWQADHNRIKRIIAKAGGEITRRKLILNLSGSMRPRDVDEHIKSLEEGGEIDVLKAIPPAGGKPIYSYRLASGSA